jgi:hypothetical protein
LWLLLALFLYLLRLLRLLFLQLLQWLLVHVFHLLFWLLLELFFHLLRLLLADAVFATATTAAVGNVFLHAITVAGVAATASASFAVATRL